MKIGLAQINTTVGDTSGNGGKIIQCHRRAEALGCELVIFPELAVTGYPPRDLVEKKAFVQDNLDALEKVAQQCRKAAAVVGFVDRNPAKVGKPVFNAAALLSRGKIEGVYHKSLLPTYDVFDEGRYFEPGERPLIFEKSGLSFGMTICEDIWIDPPASDRRLYRYDPLEPLEKASVDFIINISASPFSLHKEAVRRRMTEKLSGHSSAGIIYTNLVGGNDELIFDGASFVLDGEGKLRARAADFAEDLVIYDTETGTGDLREELGEDTAHLAEALILGLKDYVTKCGFRKVILGLSGGIDSALTAALSVRALGQENVITVIMPSRYTSPESLVDAREIAGNLKIETLNISIDSIYDKYLESLEGLFKGTDEGVTEENIQARIRGNILMAMSNKFGHLVVNTGNKSELAMGYCTLYGDLSGGLSVLGDVPKTSVYRLGAYLNGEKGDIPERVFTKPPSAELKPDQKDEDILPPYDILDPILKMYIEDNLNLDEIVAAGFPAPLVIEVINGVDINEYKRRQAPPVLRVTSKAFGMGRRLPIAQRYRHG
jgi:NAD+ synthase/NAD+ synthase (glutamine-hydrolysing)